MGPRYAPSATLVPGWPRGSAFVGPVSIHRGASTIPYRARVTAWVAVRNVPVDVALARMPPSVVPDCATEVAEDQAEGVILFWSTRAIDGERE